MNLTDNDLKNIPGIGKKIEQHLFNIGIYTIDDLKNQDAEELYIKDALNKIAAIQSNEKSKPKGAFPKRKFCRKYIVKMIQNRNRIGHTLKLKNVFAR